MPLQAFSPIRHCQFDCLFTLHVHSINGLPSHFNNASLCVVWKRNTGVAGLRTRPAEVFRGAAEFKDTLEHVCPIYGTCAGGPHHRVDYEGSIIARQFVLYATVVGAPEINLGKHQVDLTRLLPLTLEELEEQRSGKWSTSFKLLGKGKGASLNVSFGFSRIDWQSLLGRTTNVEKEADDPEVEADLDVEKGEFDDPELEGVERGGGDSSEEGCVELHQEGAELSACDSVPVEKSLLSGKLIARDVDELLVYELVSTFQSLSILEPVGLESLKVEDGTPDRASYMEVKSNYKMGKMTKSLSLDDVTKSVASEFLAMLVIEHSPFGLCSDSDPESPRERLWKQLKKDTLANSDIIFDLDTEIGTELNWGELSEDFDLSSIVHAAETDQQKATQAARSKTRAKMSEDAETRALMREWGLNEKVFQSSPHGSRSGFGSPINLPSEDPLDWPPLGDGLGPSIQTKDGGFLRSMNPCLFRFAMNNGSLVMQVSSPVVLPAEMSYEILEILQCLASGGIEKLSMLAHKLMPSEDITGKTMLQVAWEAMPSLEAHERQDISVSLKPEGESGLGQNAAGRRKRGKYLSSCSSRSGEISSEYVSLKDLVLSIEGLRIQSGMSDEDAPSNISLQWIGEISALEGNTAKNSMPLGLEGAAGLQLLDIKDDDDSVDGLMGLSLTLDEWMRLDSRIIEEDQISDRTLKLLAAHHDSSSDLIAGGWKGERRGGKNSGRRWGLLGNNFIVALRVQYRDPLRNYEPVGTPMLSLIQVEPVFVPPKTKIYCTISDKGNSEQDEEAESEATTKEETKKEGESLIPQLKITEVRVKTDLSKRKPWGNPTQQLSGSRWLLATGMGKSNKHPFMKSKTVAKPSAVTKPSQVTTTVQPGDTLWSISSHVHGTGTKWKELAALNPHIKNPNLIFPNETIRLR